MISRSGVDDLSKYLIEKNPKKNQCQFLLYKKATISRIVKQLSQILLCIIT